ncbi:MAG: tryptophanyl-tRNA synthetase [Halonotius sp. J07HN4]|nr:MAG: tryptophanyl-tRNA synthetase [Halonotius sp. J07HN4]
MTDDPSHNDDGTLGAGASDDTAASDDATTTTVSATDGGVAETTIDPWGSSTIADYRKLFEEFGIEEFETILGDVPNPHYLMRRGVIFGHRDYSPVVDALANDEPAAALSGFMPTGDPHIGHKLVFDEIIWHQQQGADAYALIADLEAHSARGIDWETIDEHAESYLLSLLALGFDAEAGELYRQSDNRELQDLAFELGSNARFAEFESIYGFDSETSVSHMQSVVTQMADMLYPQLVDGPKPTVIPVGPDQDPHVRLARDLAVRMRFFKVTEAYASFEADAAERELIGRAYDALSEAIDSDETVRCEDAADWLGDHDADPEFADASTTAIDKLTEAGKEPVRPRVRFFHRHGPEDAFEAMINAIEGDKRVYEGHIDAFELDIATAEELAREVEVDAGGYGFIQPSSIYHRFMTGLTGGKMSSSIPASHISLLDDPETGYDKVKSATTGGRETAEKQRELGGEADDCPVYELYAYLLANDDDGLVEEVYEECVGGERLCGDCKEQAATLMQEFLKEHQEKREEAKELLDDLDIDLDSDRRGPGGSQ